MGNCEICGKSTELGPTTSGSIPGVLLCRACRGMDRKFPTKTYAEKPVLK